MGGAAEHPKASSACPPKCSLCTPEPCSPSYLRLSPGKHPSLQGSQPQPQGKCSSDGEEEEKEAAGASGHWGPEFLLTPAGNGTVTGNGEGVTQRPWGLPQLAGKRQLGRRRFSTPRIAFTSLKCKLSQTHWGPPRPSGRPLPPLRGKQSCRPGAVRAPRVRKPETTRPPGPAATKPSRESRAGRGAGGGAPGRGREGRGAPRTVGAHRADGAPGRGEPAIAARPGRGGGARGARNAAACGQSKFPPALRQARAPRAEPAPGRQKERDAPPRRWRWWWWLRRPRRALPATRARGPPPRAPKPSPGEAGGRWGSGERVREQARGAARLPGK